MGFGLLYQFIPGYCIFNKLDPVSRFWLLEIIYYFICHLLFGRPLVLIPVGFQLVIFFPCFISSIPLRCPHHFILCAFVYLTISAPIINFCSSLLRTSYSPSFLVLHWSRYLPLNLPFKTNKLFMPRRDSVQVTHA